MFHFHKWKNISYWHGASGEGMRASVTLLSQECECGKWRIKQVSGVWVLQDGSLIGAHV